MSERIKDKIEQIEEFLGDLLEYRPSSYEDYINDKKTKDACERVVQKLIESVVDLAYFVVKDKQYKKPEDDEQAFDILMSEGIISEELYKNLKDAKGMRNFLVHEYGEIDDEIVFNAISENLERDVNLFLNKVKGAMK